MRLPHARPATITLIAGGVLLTTASGTALAAAAASTEASAAATAGTRSCEPLQASAGPSPSSAGTPPTAPSTGTTGTADPTPTTFTPTSATTATASGATPASAAPTRTLKSSPAATPEASNSTSPAPRHPTSAPATAARRLVKAAPAPTRTLTAQTATTTTPATPAPRQGSLCVQVTPAQSSGERGHAVRWIVSAWTTGGTVTDATIGLRAAPAGAGSPRFTFGCGTADGTPSCDLGAVDPRATPRQLQAALTVPAGASGVRSVRLTAAASTAGTASLAKKPQASATVSVTAPPSPATAAKGRPENSAPRYPPAQDPSAPSPVLAPAPAANQAPPAEAGSPLPVGNLPGIPPLGPAMSPGGNAADLFPTLHPTPAATPKLAGPKRATGNMGTRPVADTSALPEGTPVAGAQLAGLAALALAFVLAVTRLTIRRRPGQARPPDTAAGAPAERQGTENPPPPPKGQAS